MLGAGDAFMAGFLRGWLRDEPHRDLARPGRTPAAPSPCRACSARRNTRPGRSCSYFLENGSPHHALRQRRDAQPHPLGDDAPAAAGDADGASPSITARSSRRSPTRPARRASGSTRFKRLGGAGRRHRWRTGGPASACCSTTPTAARRCSLRPSCRSGSAGRSSSRAPARSASSSTQDIGVAARRMAARRTRSSASPSTIPTTTPALQGRADGDAPHALRRGAAEPARAPRRDHREPPRPARRRHDGARRSRALRRRHQAGLVEARAAGLGRGLAGGREGHPPATIPGAAASCSSASKRRRRARGGLRRRGFARRSSRASRSAARSSTTRRENGSPARSTTRRRSPTWPTASPG